MPLNKTILERIGISDKTVSQWKRRGLKITYPTRERAHFFKSDDGEVFVESGDKFVPPLSREEERTYRKSPEKFKEDSLKNVRLYIKFCNFIFKAQKKIKRLKGQEKIAALLTMLYLFQRAMDYHYYHWDRYLVYQNYPSTPVGYWWEKLKNLYIKATGEKVLKDKPPEGFLRLLTGEKKTLQKLKKSLSEKDFAKLKEALRAIKIFEDTQQREVEVVTDFQSKENIFIRTAFPMWNEFCGEINRYSEVIRKGRVSDMERILNFHPIIAIRKIMLPETLSYFNREVFLEFKKEIKRWLK